MINKERLIWCDALRMLAFFLLFCCHAADPFNAVAYYGSPDPETGQAMLTWGNIWGSLVRPCVPLFVMLTGVLSLPVNTSMEAFYKKRIPRVLFPFVIWSAIYYLTLWITGLMGLDSSIVRKLFPWAETDSQAIVPALANIARIPYTFSFIASHMWYIYMLIGLYLYLPIFSTWVERATRRQKEIILGLWVLSTFLPYFNEYVSHDAFGTCDWNAYGLFYYFAGFSGYMLLGHYIQHHIDWGMKRRLCIAVFLFTIGFLVTYFGYSHIVSLPEKTNEQMELFWTYNSPNVVMMSLACFLIVNRIYIPKDSLAAHLLANLTTCGFGIYMIHYLFVHLGFEIGDQLHIPMPLRIPFSAIVIFCCSWPIVAAGKKWLGRWSKYVLG